VKHKGKRTSQDVAFIVFSFLNYLKSLPIDTISLVSLLIIVTDVFIFAYLVLH